MQLASVLRNSYISRKKLKKARQVLEPRVDNTGHRKSQNGNSNRV